MEPMPWAVASPSIAKLGRFKKEDVLSLLTTGARVDGSRPLPPMPTFAFEKSDADAVVEYLMSLPDK